MLRRLAFCHPLHLLKRIKLWKRSIHNYLYDIRRFLKYSTTMSSVIDLEHLEAKIIAHCHVIEKGMSLKEVRFGYGKEIIESLLDLLDQYISNNYSRDNIFFKAAISSLWEYVKFHEENNYDVTKLKKRLDTSLLFENFELGGTIELKRDEILKYSKADFYNFSKNRHSIRNFSGKLVDLSLLKKAVRIAQKTPSVCNRQSSRVYIIQDENIKKSVLEYQPGNRGFGHLADKVLLVTSDLQSFFDINERNQAFIDAGMFGMSLLYGLYYIGLGACALGWMVESEIDKKLRKLVGINDSEIIAFIVIVGNIPEMVKVPKSIRKKLDDVVLIR